jgi:hypothetical protein
MFSEFAAGQHTRRRNSALCAYICKVVVLGRRRRRCAAAAAALSLLKSQHKKAFKEVNPLLPWHHISTFGT